jgi:hypothetical protein
MRADHEHGEHQTAPHPGERDRQPPSRHPTGPSRRFEPRFVLQHLRPQVERRPGVRDRIL